MKSLGFVYAVAAAVLWGLVYAVDEKILTKISPIALMFATSFLVVLMTAPLLLFEEGAFGAFMRTDRQTLLLILFSVMIVTIANFCILSAINILGAPTASVLEISYPFFVALFGWLFYRAGVSPSFLAGGALIFLGSFIIIRFS